MLTDPTSEHTKSIHIYCDGGFGNRYNALVSGLAIADLLQLQPRIYWPCNSWCGAAFASLFSTETCASIAVADRSLTQLKGTLNNLTPLLHDDIGAQSLGVKFASAYAYASIDELRTKALADSAGLLYYPALIPAWLPPADIATAAARLSFHPDIVQRTLSFLDAELPGPFHGIHLRRTDLSIGLSDDEVHMLAISHPRDSFFVCSDDPLAERIAAAHANIKRRPKTAYVSKRTSNDGWNHLTLDDDQRPYHSNIERKSAAVIEAVIDLLVLAHSSIVGYSGFTFQAVARLIGNAAPLAYRPRPAEIPVLPLGDCLRQLSTRRLTTPDLLNTGNRLAELNSPDSAIQFLQAALNHSHGAQAFPLRFNLALLLYNCQRYGEAEAFVRIAIDDYPSHADSYLLAAQIFHQSNQLANEVNILVKGLEIAHRSQNTVAVEKIQNSLHLARAGQLTT